MAGNERKAKKQGRKKKRKDKGEVVSVVWTNDPGDEMTIALRRK